MFDEGDPNAIIVFNNSRRRQINIPVHRRLVDPRLVTDKISEDLRGKKVCVLSGNSTISSQDLQKILISFGAQPVPHAGVLNFDLIFSTF
jgi:hypothetical protein